MHFSNKHTSNPLSAGMSKVNLPSKMANINLSQLNQMNQLYEDEYEEDQSEPLIEQIDEKYQPTPSEIKEYAIETLGMSFPEDQNLLYLAREGLKAPLPPNWVPYQSRDGSVYYKHRITQEKIYDHPTDREYKKKYEQQKEKMARTNLKSIGLKNAAGMNMVNQIGISNLGNQSGLFSKGGGQLQTVPSVKLDPKIEQSYEQQLLQIQVRLKKEWKQFELQEQQKHQKKLKRHKQEYQKAIALIISQDNLSQSIDEQIKAEKQSIKSKIQKQSQQNLERELKEYERELELKNQDYSSLYREDNQLKIKKYRHEKDQNLEDKERTLNDLLKRFQEEKQKKKRQTTDKLASLRQELEKQENHEIEHATSIALSQQLSKIKLDYSKKLKQKEQQLENEYNETKRVLGYDQGSYLTEIALKKARIKQLSVAKIDSIKKKEIGLITSQANSELNQSYKKFKEQNRNSIELIKSKAIKEEEDKLQKQKQKIDAQTAQKLDSRIKQIYQDSALRISQFQTTMNKKITSIQSSFIEAMQKKDNELDHQITSRLQLKEKESIIENKHQLIQSIRRQFELERCTYQALKMRKQISGMANQKEITDYLMRVSKQFDVAYKPEIYHRVQQQLSALKSQYKQDKQMLASLMIKLQGTQHKYNRVGEDQEHSGHLMILKSYNQDVRTLRENDEKIHRLEMLLKKIEINDQKAIEELENHPEILDYKQIQLRNQFGGKQLDKFNRNQRNQIKNIEQTVSKPYQPIYSNLTHQNIEDTLKQHSKFLSTVKHELNRKLYQIRNHSFYNY